MYAMLRSLTSAIIAASGAIAAGACALARDRRGNIATAFALSIIPVVAAGGAAIDVSRAMVVKSRLAHALDSAGLAIGSTPGLSIDQATTLAQRYFDANYPAGDLGIPGRVSVSVTDNRMRLQATAQVDMTLARIVGFDYWTVNVAAEVIRETKKLEVALVLDTTGSMNTNNKIGGLRTAATDLITILFGEIRQHPMLRVSIVPFVTTVNVNAPGFQQSWMDNNAQATWHGLNFARNPDGTRVNHFDLFNRIRNVQWKGCVESRADPYDTDDTPPNPAVPDTLFVPYFWPDDPDSNTSSDPAFMTAHPMNQYSNSYLSDLVTGSQRTRQMSTAKYNNRNASVDDTPSDTRGPNRSCGHALTPLTNNRDTLLSRISELRAWNDSGTNIAIGLYWGWATLSPGQPFTEGAPYTDEETNKALVLLTDGENVVFGGYNAHNRSHYGGYNYLVPNDATGRFNTTNASTAASRVNDRVATLCTRIKAEGIRVYTILFDVSSASMATLFRNCASEPSLYFNNVTSDQLRQTFQQIANDLSNLRLSR